MLECFSLLIFVSPRGRLSHFELSWRHRGWWQACGEVFRAVIGDSTVFAHADNAAFDMTVHSAHRWNQVRKKDKRACPVRVYLCILLVARDTKYARFRSCQGGLRYPGTPTEATGVLPGYIQPYCNSISLLVAKIPPGG